MQNGVDFIICYAVKEEQQIFEIKNGNCTQANSSWIGSHAAFNYFQGVQTGNIDTKVNSSNPLGVEISFGHANQSPLEIEYQNLFEAFHKVLFDCGDTTVGGFVVPVVWDCTIDSFKYHEYMKTYSSFEYKNDVVHLPMYQPASSGAYSILFYKSTSTVGFFLPQPSLGVVYSQHRKDSNDYSNSSTSSLPLPQVKRMSQLDFYIQVGARGLSPPGFLACDPDDINEIFKRIWAYKDNPAMALLYIDKIIEIIETQRRDEHRLEEFRSIKRNIESSLE